MSSLHAFLRDYIQFNYSVPEIVERYVEWVNIVTYMILSRWNGSENEVFAVKCAKRGNDVYRSRVSSRFAGLSSRAEDLVFFNPKDRGAKKTRALWVTLTNDTKRCSFGEDACISASPILQSLVSHVTFTLDDKAPTSESV